MKPQVGDYFKFKDLQIEKTYNEVKYRITRVDLFKKRVWAKFQRYDRQLYIEFNDIILIKKHHKYKLKCINKYIYKGK